MICRECKMPIPTGARRCGYCRRVVRGSVDHFVTESAKNLWKLIFCVIAIVLLVGFMKAIW